MIKIGNWFENSNIKEVAKSGNIHVVEYQKNLSVRFENAALEYYAHMMNIRKKQVLIELKGDAYTISAGTMQWTAGKVVMTSGVKGVGDLIGKAFSASVTKESAIKPVYQGNGFLVLEPTYKHVLLEDVRQWDGGMVVEDGLFLGCQASVSHKVVARSNISSAVLGKEGMFNLMLHGDGVAILESTVPRSELITVMLENDEIRIDGPLAVAWSQSLEFTVEKSSKNILSAAVSGEGFVNVYRGTGRVLMAPSV